jgi:LuxR family maltose regulon positive regulatory protein
VKRFRDPPKDDFVNPGLLNTKIYIPIVDPKLVARPHLIERLNAGLQGKLTLVSAPAGFGKTTLISDWIRQSEMPFCWISLDENDSDPGRFLAYLIASLQSIQIEVDPEPIKLLQDPEKGQIETILNGLINQIADEQIRFALVLDDYHHIQNHGVHEILSYLLEHLPPKVNMVIITRADPPLNIARLRVRGQLTEFRAADLRFNISEGRQFLNQITELNLDSDDVEKLVSRTDGWIAGLQLASITLKGRQDRSNYIQHFSGSQDFVVDFLTAEVLNQQPKYIQDFLLKTAILKRLTASLCQSLTGRKDSQQILKELRGNNIFLNPLDDENQWFAYHRLFRDLLTQQLLEKHANLIPDLYLNASFWSEKHNFWDEAIDYAIEGQHFDRAADLVESQAQNTLQQSEITNFLGWVDRIPASTINARPDLCIYAAWALLLSNQNTEIAAQYLDQVTTIDTVTQAKLNTVRSIQAAFQRQIPESISFAKDALQQLPKDEYFFRQIGGWNLSGALFLSGDEDEGIKVLEDVARVSIASNNRMVATISLCRLGSIWLQRGDLFLAHDYFQQAMRIASQGLSKPIPAACEAMLGLGKIYWERYQLESAFQMLTDGLDLSKRWRDVVTIDGRITLAHLLLTQGNVGFANKIMSTAKEIISPKIQTETGKNYVDLQEAHLQLRQRNLAFARVWAEKRSLEKFLLMEKLSPSSSKSSDMIRALELGVFARILLAEKEYNQALQLLSILLPEITRLGHKSKIIETNILAAVAHQGLGNQEKAIGSIKSVLDMAAPAEYIRIFIEDGHAVFYLFTQLQTQGPLSHFIQKILGVSANVVSQTNQIEAAVDSFEPLSEREIEVLRLLESELNVPEIAADIHISVSTLRTHIRNIYRKLDTHSRFETISKAKKMNII